MFARYGLGELWVYLVYTWFCYLLMVIVLCYGINSFVARACLLFDDWWFIFDMDALVVGAVYLLCLTCLLV